MDEIWLPIVGFGNCYSISNFGQVERTSPRNIKRLAIGSRAKPFVPSLCRSFVNRGGYLQVRIGPTGHQKTVQIHILVGRAFVHNPNGYKEINHIDGNKLNNYPKNLEWTTRKANMRHARDTGLLKVRLGEDAPASRLTDKQVLQIRADTRPHLLIAAEHGICRSNVSMIKRGCTWSHLISLV